MLTLFSTPPAWGIPSLSPFCLKVETYLRMAKIPYEVRAADMRRAPKGKIPWIDDDGVILGDSSAILDYLKEKHGDPLDGKLSPLERSRLHLLQCTIEDHTYFALAYLRWSAKAGRPHLKEALAPVLPPIGGGLIVKLIGRSVRKAAYAQGIARHTHAEIVTSVRRDLEVFSLELGDNPYFFGEVPTSLDAIMYGFLAQIYHTPWETEANTIARDLGNLVDYEARMQERYFPN